MKKLIQTSRNFKEKHKKKLRITKNVVTLILLFLYLICLPDKLFNDSTSTVLYDRNGNLLGARIADDGQWRFPESTEVPDKFKTCIIEFEDRNFESHIGISVIGIARAVSQNMHSDKVVSGGSTITMQLVRIMHKNPERTYFEKLKEMILATRIELHYSKEEILNLYASHAPFGNNVVGLETASWRFFGRKSNQLSWAESATLAVLPNAPGLIYPGKNHDLLLKKRNRLLKRLRNTGKIDETTYRLAIREQLPEKPLALPQLAPHLLAKFSRYGLKGKAITSSIDSHIQEKVIRQLASHHSILKENNIFNGAVIVTSVKTGEILAYVGNTDETDSEFGNAVDCADAPRSSGSILKPFLYAKSLEDGIITPEMLLLDIPSQFGSFSPKNFTGSYNGALPANNALSRSLNIPMVHLLSEYGVSKFHSELQEYGFTTFKKPAKHYGLSLILGGGEVKLTDLSKTYTQMAQELANKKSKKLTYFPSTEEHDQERQKTRTDRACIYATFEAMSEVNRPNEEDNWKYFSSTQKIAWKTGTSFGFRDAWSVGVTPDYVVAVWVGNADGEGRPGLTGIGAAAPLMFDVFRQLKKSEKWFEEPRELMQKVKICHESGHRATGLCKDIDYERIPKTALNTKACPYHQLIHLNKISNQRVDSECESIENMKHEAWFILPSIVEKFYKNTHPNYRPIPDYKSECWSKVSSRSLAIIYPKNNAQIYVPIEINSTMGQTIFEATHRSQETKVYWHLDENFIGTTQEMHQMALNPALGLHRLTLVDEQGVSTQVEFEIIGKNH